MEATQVIKSSDKKMGNAVDHVFKEFNTIHTGKASPTIVENISIDAYGSAMRLKDVAGITTPDPRTISIQPWDKGLVNAIAKAIQKENIGLNPVADSNVVRCPIPDLSGERRKELVKVAHNMAEEGRISVRSVRRDAMDQLKAQKETMSEDELKRLEKEVQTITDKHIAEIAKHLDHKEKELMAV